MPVTPTEFVKTHAPWSNSKADCVKQCPYQFYLRYIQKIKKPTNYDARLGQAAHSAIEFALCGRNVESSLKFAAEEHNLTSVEQEALLFFNDNIKQFLQKFNDYRTRFNASEPKTEQQLAIGWDGKPIKYFSPDGFLRGVIDLYIIRNKGSEVVILDHKTGKRKDARFYKGALDIYKVLLKAHRPELKTAKLAIHYVRDAVIEFIDDAHKNRAHDLSDTGVIVDNLITHLNKITANIDLQEKRKGPLCPWCDYREECPAYEGNNDKDQKDRTDQGTTMEGMDPAW